MICERCNGEGQVPKGPYFAPDGDDLFDVCGACGGDGEVGESGGGDVTWVDILDFSFGPTLVRPCPTCEGVGDKTCPTCGDMSTP